MSVNTISIDESGAVIQVQAKTVAIEAFDREVAEDRQLICNSILHCSDIGNPLLPQDMSVEWAKMIQDEFYAQVHSIA